MWDLLIQVSAGMPICGEYLIKRSLTNVNFEHYTVIFELVLLINYMSLGTNFTKINF